MDAAGRNRHLMAQVAAQLEEIGGQVEVQVEAADEALLSAAELHR